MRICIIGDGISIHVKRWVDFFIGRGHEVHVITSRPDRSGKAINHRLWLRLGKPGYGINARFVRSMVARIKPDIVQAHYVVGHGYYAAFSGFHPCIVSAWGSDIMKDAKSSETIGRQVSFTLQNADAVTCTSASMLTILRKEYSLGEKAMFIPWGIDTKTFHRGNEEKAAKLRAELGIPADAPVVLSARGLMPVYGAQHIIEAIPLVLKKHSNAHFVFLIGSKFMAARKNMEKLRKRAAELGVSGNVRFVDRMLLPEELAVFMNMADVSTSFVPYGQFGAALLESMNCGCVPLASDIPIHREKLTHMKNALLVDMNNKDDVASKINHFVSHPVIKEEFYKLNRELVDSTENWQKSAALTEKLYLELIEKKKGKV